MVSPAAPLPAADGPAELSFVAWMERRLAEQPPKQKGQRTRERLKIAVAKVLAAKGYHALRVTDVTSTAGVAEGSFYVYFKDKTDASLHVLSSLLNDFYAEHLRSPGAAGTPFQAVQRANRRWVALAQANAGLIRCVLQAGDEIPEFAELVHQTNHSWYRRVAAAVVKRFPEGALSAEAALLAIYLLGAMMDEITRKLIVYPEPAFLELLESLGQREEVLADAATALWVRCLYPGLRLDEPLPPGAELLWRWPDWPGASNSRSLARRT